MKVVQDSNLLAEALDGCHQQGAVALVPTMGALHDGHLALIRRARELADTVVVSSYVNPRQFGAGEDFSAYPRTAEQDAAHCAAAGVDLLFVPNTLYVDGGAKVSLMVDESLSSCLCGRYRISHFDGVATVVAILFHLVRPNVALFGMKDYQQLQIIRRMVGDLCFPVQIEAGATVREADGLAMSSRNLRLGGQGRALAPTIYRVMDALRQQCVAGEISVAVLEQSGCEALRAAGIDVEYLEIRDGDALQRMSVVDRASRLFVAARIDGVRLIDNLALGA
ncbi:MAG: pantoate--beta-alanine ligase [Mariprofundales bacterium]|nr:pantoate--beta-alanine ligase [Mariprofundales bacterium]